MANKCKDLPFFKEATTSTRSEVTIETDTSSYEHFNLKLNNNSNYNRIKLSNKNVKVMHLNIQSLNNKLIDIELLLNNLDNEIDILCIDEHWLTSAQLESAFLRYYKVANAFCRTQLKHGGTLIYVKESMNIKPLAIINEFNVEQVFECCGIHVIDLNIVVIAVYRSPLGDFNIFCEKLDHVLFKFVSYSNIIICGDFNVDFLTHSTNQFKLLSLLTSYNIYPTVNFPTRVTSASSKCIDNILTNLNLQNINTIPIQVDFSDHDAQLIELIDFNVMKANTKSVYKYTRMFNDKNIANYLDDISRINWDFLSLNSKGKNFNQFAAIINKALNAYFPKTEIRQRANIKQWITKGIKISSKNKRNLYRLNLFFKNNILDTYYKKYSNILKSIVIEAKRRCIHNEISTAKNKIKTTWSVIRRECNRNKQYQTNLTLVNNVCPKSFGTKFNDLYKTEMK